MSTPEQFDVAGWVDATREPVPEEFVWRRRVSDRLAAIGHALVRADITPAQLQALEHALSAIPLPVGRHDQWHINERLESGTASASDVLMGFDYDAASGASNPAAPTLTFNPNAGTAPDGRQALVEAYVTLDAMHGGGPGNAHGGVLAAMLDVVLARVHQAAGYLGVTGYLNLRYLHPTPLFQPLVVRAWPVGVTGRKARVNGGVWCGDVQTVEAEALFIARRKPVLGSEE